MSINLIFILLTLEFILFLALMYLILTASDKLKEFDNQLDENMQKVKEELSELRVSINIIKRHIEENIYSEKLLKKEVKAFGKDLAMFRIRKILKIAGKGASANKLFSLWRFKSLFIHSLKLISK